MKIKATPPVERTFTLELTETELATLRIALGMTRHTDRAEDAKQRGIEILDSLDTHRLFNDIYNALGNNK